MSVLHLIMKSMPNKVPLFLLSELIWINFWKPNLVSSTDR